MLLFQENETKPEEEKVLWSNKLQLGAYAAQKNVAWAIDATTVAIKAADVGVGDLFGHPLVFGNICER